MKFTKGLKFILVLLLIVQMALATAQAPDCLTYNGEKYDMFTNPLEYFFREFPKKRPGELSSTALWRGYIATFEIIQNELWVIDIETESFSFFSDELKRRSVIKKCLDGKSKMKVEGFSGLLTLPQGKMLDYVHMGYESLYERYKLIEIENGNYVAEFDLDSEQYKKYRDAQRAMYDDTDKYQKQLRLLNNEKLPKEALNYFVKTYAPKSKKAEDIK